jgi:hypothetical protein
MEYTWTIAQLERKTSDGFVVTVHYRVTAVDGEYTASTYSTVGYTQESDTFIPFADLTEATVVGWVKDSLGEETVQEALASQIEAQKFPTQISGMPW